MYLVALIIVNDNIIIRHMPITETIVISINGVLIIKNYQICKEKPMLNTTPSPIPPKRATIKRIII